MAKIAIDEDVDVVALSLLNGAHLRLFPRVKSLLGEKVANNIVVIGEVSSHKMTKKFWKDKELKETLDLEQLWNK